MTNSLRTRTLTEWLNEWAVTIAVFSLVLAIFVALLIGIINDKPGTGPGYRGHDPVTKVVNGHEYTCLEVNENGDRECWRDGVAGR